MKDVISFISKSKTAYHCIEQLKNRLKEAGFEEIEKWSKTEKLQPGKGYFTIRNQSSMIAFVTPKEKTACFHVWAAHSDSPAWKIKENPEITVDNHYVKLNVEKYGGMIVSTWLDRPLGIAGRIVKKANDGFVSENVDLGNACCVIPNLAIHLNREINKGYEYNPQTDMCPLLTLEKETTILDFVANHLQMEKEDILGSDLYLYNGEEGKIVGLQEEFLTAPRLDDLLCVYAGLQGMVSCMEENRIPSNQCNVLAVFHNEEVGSRTLQGADSDFLKNVLEKIRESTSSKDAMELYGDSFMISADNAHGVHPNHGEKSDITNRPYLNQGVVLKFHGGAQYTTDGFSAAVVRDLAKHAKIKLQDYANRSDIAGGSTLGNVALSQLSIPAADIGVAQLAMHSAMETAGTKDIKDMITLCREFYK